MILETLKFSHAKFPKTQLVAHAYRGSEMRKCLEMLFATLTSNNHPADLVAFIGHNGLMEHQLPMPKAETGAKTRDAVILCCVSQSYFQNRLENAGIRPVLLTDQLMYPASAVLHDLLEGWLRGENREQMRQRAGAAMAKNQKISVKAAKGIFADLGE